MRFVIVNGRMPRERFLCVMCDVAVGTNYLREVGTNLIYCDPACYAAHCENAVRLIDGHAMASLNDLASGAVSARLGERTVP